MQLNPGDRLGPYEIVSPLGAGGMAEVYRATDARLQRTVAIKILRPELADVAEVRERFAREARAASRLNHPHICVVHDVGTHDGMDYLVMEYVEGETLASVLAKGPLLLSLALRYAIEVADALDKAHRQGVTHRDLKPANIMVSSGGIKLLDFGLARLTEPSSGGNAALSFSRNTTDITNLTLRGSIIGTVQYMAPEQLEGLEVDARTDIFAFGTVLYEMVCGRKPFEGRSHAALVSAIISSEHAKPSKLRDGIPTQLDHVIERCLAKEPDDRWQTAGDVMRELKWIYHGTRTGSGFGARTPLPVRALVLVAFMLACLIALVGIGWIYRRSEPPDPVTMRLSVLPPRGENFALSSGGAPWPALSPDGRQIVFGATFEGKTSIWLRSIDSETPHPLAGTEGGSQPFWSPDGRFIAFFAGGRLKKLEIAGGGPQTICELPANPREGTWNADGAIVFAVNGNPLFQVPAAGGTAQPLTTLDTTRSETAHQYPSFLPDGQHFLFLAQSANPAETAISLGSLTDAKDVRRLVHINSKSQFAPPGFLVYIKDGGLVAQSFDPATLEVTGQAARIAENVRHTAPSGLAAFSVSRDGAIAYSGDELTEYSQLAWYSRAGRQIETVGVAGSYLNPALSPDGRMVTLDRMMDNSQHVWLFEFARRVFTPLTAPGSRDSLAVWSQSSQEIVFFADRKNEAGIYRKAIDGSGSEEKLYDGRVNNVWGWSADGKQVIFAEGESDVSGLSLENGHKVESILQSRSFETEPALSRDSRWLAYVSNETGQFEIHARSFPSGRNRVQISTNGGLKPRWRADGREIFYLGPDSTLMSVSVTPGDTLKVKSPEALFKVQMIRSDRIQPGVRQQYDVSDDGQRFLILQGDPNASRSITIYTNWAQKLK